MKIKETMKPGEWVETIVASIGEFFRLETTYGIRRSGKITGFTFRTFFLNDVLISMPIEIEVNGDPGDRITLDCVKTMSIG